MAFAESNASEPIWNYRAAFQRHLTLSSERPLRAPAELHVGQPEVSGTSKRAALLSVWLTLASFPAVGEAESVSRDELLAAGQATLVSQIEAGLPDVPVAAWLRSLVGPGSSLSWGLNDCGEQTGVLDADATRNLPICAELEASLSQGRSVYLYFLVGTQAQGVVESRGLYFAGILGGGQDLSFPDLKTLAAHLRKSGP